MDLARTAKLQQEQMGALDTIHHNIFLESLSKGNLNHLAGSLSTSIGPGEYYRETVAAPLGVWLTGYHMGQFCLPCSLMKLVSEAVKRFGL